MANRGAYVIDPRPKFEITVTTIRNMLLLSFVRFLGYVDGEGTMLSFMCATQPNIYVSPYLQQGSVGIGGNATPMGAHTSAGVLIVGNDGH